MTGLELKKGSKLVIREDIRFGLFGKHLKKDYKKLINDLEDYSHYGIPFDVLSNLLEKIKALIGYKIGEDKIEDIFIVPSFNRWGDDSDSPCFTVEVGRYETDEEYDDRVKRRAEEQERQRQRQLRDDAKKLIELQKKFKVSP